MWNTEGLQQGREVYLMEKVDALEHDLCALAAALVAAPMSEMVVNGHPDLITARRILAHHDAQLLREVAGKFAYAHYDRMDTDEFPRPHRKLMDLANEKKKS